MISQEMLQAISNIHPNAQERLPILPNNGNPRGANNMPTLPQTEGVPSNQPPAQQPTVQASTQPPVASPYYYPWLAPSPSLDAIRQLGRPQATAPAQQALAATPNDLGQLILPQRNGLVGQYR